MTSSPLQAVLDTNVFLRIILSKKPEGVASALWRLLQEGRFTLVMSPRLLEELRATLSVPQLAELHGWNDEQIGDYVAEVAGRALMVPGIAAVDAPELAERDSSDLELVIAAEEAGALIVTQDADLLDLEGSPGLSGLEILDPLGFLRRVRAND